MKIIRQKLYSDQDHAGIDTGLKGKLLDFNRGRRLRQIKRSRRRNQKDLERNLNSRGMGFADFEIEGSNGQTIKGRRIVNLSKEDGGKLNNRNAAVEAENMVGRYNQKNQRALGRATTSGITTKNKPTSIYQAFNPTQEAAGQESGKKKLGLGGKVAIGAAGAAALYGGYKYLQNRKAKKEEEERLARQGQQ